METIDLSGRDGNAIFLLGTARGLCRKLDMDEASIMAELRSGDYKNLIAVFEKHFSEFVTLENKPEDVKTKWVYLVTVTKFYEVESEVELSDDEILSRRLCDSNLYSTSSGIEEIEPE